MAAIGQSPEGTFVLTSWKEIACYLGKGVRTVQRWEQHLGLPVRRPTGAARRHIVLARRSDLDAWIAQHWSETFEDDPVSKPADVNAIHEALHNKIHISRELVLENQALLQQLQQTLGSLALQLGLSSRLVSQEQPGFENDQAKNNTGTPERRCA